MHKIFLTIIAVVATTLAVLAQTTATKPAQQLFQEYMAQAVQYADAYPREKAYLHLDNSSYYIGDTIWFKAYVTTPVKEQLSTLSRPLYVELIDQAGHVTSKVIVRLKDGVGEGQIPLDKSFLSGYYEIRAFTKWMMSFAEPEYFSRTMPIYAIQGDETKTDRSLINFKLSPSMKKRPTETNKALNVRFFPEGGYLVDNVTSRVAFKAESNDSANIAIEGNIIDDNGNTITQFSTLHDGMGVFEFTPNPNRQATAKVNYNGKEYSFKLPKALSEGYALTVNNSGGALSIKVACNANTPADTVGVFVSSQGKPYHCQILAMNEGDVQEFMLPVRKLPAGVLQVSLINKQGVTLSDRMVFAYPMSPIRIKVDGIKDIYAPYEKINGNITATSGGNPFQGAVSVSVTDRLRSDYFEFDNNIYTDLLLTSELKGYIHQPGYYFSNITQKSAELDVLMMVHGWRRYDLSKQIGNSPFSPANPPESQLLIEGVAKSTILKRPLKNIELTVLARQDSKYATGNTITDENGYFAVPMDNFRGNLEALFQTRKQGKSKNQDALIMLRREFGPEARAYSYRETHPIWTNPDSTQRAVEKYSKTYIDSLRHKFGTLLLGELEVVAKKRNEYSRNTKINERSIDAYYNVPHELDMLRDKGKIVQNMPTFLEHVSQQFYWDRSDADNAYNISYRQKPIAFVMDNKILSETERKMMITEIDGLQSIIIADGKNGIAEEVIHNSRVSNRDSIDVAHIENYAIFYLIPMPRRSVLDTHTTAAQGTRATIIQGYTPIVEKYSPVYPDDEVLYDRHADYRRTLYWNPNLPTDINGAASFECFNNQFTTPVMIRVETIDDYGRMGSATVIPSKK